MEPLQLKQLMDAQSAVAMGIADKNIKIIWGAPTPSADLRTQTIHLPMLPEEIDDRSLQVMRGYVDQKTSRLLYTDSSAWEDCDDITLAIGNFIEDGRCMRLLGERLYGCKLNIEAALEACDTTAVVQQLATAKEKGAKVYAVTRAILALTPISDGIPLEKALIRFEPDEELRQLFRLIDDVTAKLAKITTTDEAVTCARTIRSRWEAYLDTPPPVVEPQDGEGEDEQGGAGSGQGDKDKKKKQKGEGEDESDSSDSSSDGDGESGERSEGDEGQGEPTEDSEEEAKEDEGDGSDRGDAGSDDGDSDEGESNQSNDGDGDGDETDKQSDGGGAQDDSNDTGEGDSPEGSLDGDGAEDGKKTDRDNGGQNNWRDTQGVGDAEVKYKDDYGLDRSEENLKRATEILRQAAEEAARHDVGTVLGKNVKFAMDYEKSQRKVTQSYLAWSELDELVDVCNDRGPFIDDLLVEARTATGYLKSRLAQDLLSRGPVWIRDRDKGRLDDKKLHRVAVDDGRVFKRRRSRPKIDAAITLLVDCSASMAKPARKIWLAQQLAIVFTEACEMLDVAIEVLGFTTVVMAGIKNKAMAMLTQTFTRCEPIRHLIVKPFNKRFAERLNAYANLMGVGLRDNVDGEAILWAARRLAERREKHKHLFVLSDGMPNALGDKLAIAQHLRGSIQRVERSGISCIGLGMLSNHVKNYYSDYVIWEDLEDLLTGGYEKLSAILSADRDS